MKTFVMISVFTLGMFVGMSAKSFEVEKLLKTIQSSVEGEKILKSFSIGSEYQVEGGRWWCRLVGLVVEVGVDLVGGNGEKYGNEAENICRANKDCGCKQGASDTDKSEQGPQEA